MTPFAEMHDNSPRLADEDAAPPRPPVVDANSESKLNPPCEYEVLDLAGLASEALKGRLNELGEEGWALVSTAPAFIFRRMKKVEEKKPRARVGFGIG
jgi:hypothetical protein